MTEEENKPKESVLLTVRGKRILLESAGDHRMWADVFETGEIVLHEMFGVPTSDPTTLEEVAAMGNSCYHVTIAIKQKYVVPLIHFLTSEDLFTFSAKESDTPDDRAAD